MFNNGRYATRGVADNVPPDVQAIIWGIIDEKRRQGRTLDYLQVFELSMECALGEVFQKVIRRQEQPSARDELYFRGVSTPWTGKVWVIDDDDHSTMLFPSEY